MLLDSEAARELYLVFQDECNYIGRWFFKKGFRHVFALERQALGWICIDPARSDFYCSILPAGFADDVAGCFAKMNKGCTVMQLFVQRPLTESWNYPQIGAISCVGIIQYALAIYCPLIITPYQLYYMLSNKRIAHIKVGKVWAAGAQSVEPIKQQSSHE